MALFSLLVSGCLTAFAAILSLFVWRIVYNLYFHPLSHFPGPKLAACSRLWLAYRELIKGESLSDLRTQLHRQYGEIVRWAPNELHFSNPAAYNDIYNNRNKWDKDHSLYRAYDLDTSTFGLTHYSDAKQRRDVLAPFFSRTSIIQLQDLIQERANVLCDALAQQFAEDKSSDLVLGFHCFAVDVIMNLCYAKNWDATKVPDFRSDIVLASQAVLPIFTMNKYSGPLLKMMRYIPMRFGKKYGTPVTKALFFLRETLMRQVYGVLRNPSSLDNASHKTIYHSLLSRDAKGRRSLSKVNLWHEAGALLGGGSDTIATASTTISYYVLHNLDIQQRLVNELRTAWPVLEEVPRYEVFEKLPYLETFLQTAVVKEGVRMFPEGASLPRVVPPEGATIIETFIPGGAIVGQSYVHVNFSPAVFPDPHAFIPDRWLGEHAKTYEAALATFSKGPRGCVGIKLAYCELQLVIAAVFRRFDVTLDARRSGDLTTVEHFVPVFKGPHLRAYCKHVSD
ncbi:putative P450 monooxygenase [Lactarius akahatsu]|uniref:P450 monooxygenase n=1 Tax=Lactarius akahatsu TaxID=416441 RepID=A0AAD4LBF6_9AGAM|nr:putative P450 monooxygenase [Lactarius akahatsu]